jgi:hypothetical protein
MNPFQRQHKEATLGTLPVSLLETAIKVPPFKEALLDWAHYVQTVEESSSRRQQEKPSPGMEFLNGIFI